MADRAQAPKVVGYALTGAPDTAKVSKCVAYLLVVPSDAPDTSNRQGHCYSRIIVKAR
jgi:hypothetical protein